MSTFFFSPPPLLLLNHLLGKLSFSCFNLFFFTLFFMFYYFFLFVPCYSHGMLVLYPNLVLSPLIVTGWWQQQAQHNAPLPPHSLATQFLYTPMLHRWYIYCKFVVCICVIHFPTAHHCLGALWNFKYTPALVATHEPNPLLWPLFSVTACLFRAMPQKGSA